MNRDRFRNALGQLLLIEIFPKANISSWTFTKMWLVVPEGHDNIYDIE